MALLNFILFAVSALVMVKSGEWVVRSLSRIAFMLKMKAFVIGFIIMALSTTMPELFVGITSGMNKNTSLALGTVIGSNIVNVTLVIGIAAILGRGMKVGLQTIKTDLRYMIGIAAVPVVLMIDGTLSRFDGVILIAIFIFYMGKQIHAIPIFTKLVKNHAQRGMPISELIPKLRYVLKSFGIFAASFVVLFISAQFVVKYALAISVDMALPPILVGLVVVAVGTSLPELTFGVRAVLAKQSGMALGDIIGAVVVNSTLVLGVTSLIYPISAKLLIFFTSAIFMLIVLFVFITFAESNKKLSTNEGISLILLYIFFLMIEFYLELSGA